MSLSEVACTDDQGVAALGALLGPDYEAVIQERIGLPDVTTALDAEQLGRLAPGHDENGRPVVTPTYPLGAPSGGLYGTTADLLVFVRQYLTPDAARRLAVTDRLCWMVDGERVWHNGALPGYRGYLAFCPVAGTGVAVLSNTAISVDDLGVDVLSGLRPTADPATPPSRQAEASPEPGTPTKHKPGRSTSPRMTNILWTPGEAEPAGTASPHRASSAALCPQPAQPQMVVRNDSTARNTARPAFRKLGEQIGP